VATDFGDIGKINTRLKKEFLARSPYGYYIPDSLIDIWEPDPLRFTGSTYIITNHKVASAASYFILLTKNNGTVMVIGTETCGGGYSGNGFRMLEYQLPASGIRFNFPYAKMIYSYNERKTGRGLIPDYAVPDTYSSFIKNEDCQLLYINDSLILKNK
jgi:C-terminal processing protease CtpA/Prc